MRPVARLAAAFVLAALLIPMAPAPALAQVRAALTRDMDSPIRGTRFVELASIRFDAGTFSDSPTIAPVVPAGKKLFLQSVSMHTLLTDGQSLMEARLTVSLQGSPIAKYWINQTFQAAGSSQRHFTGNLDLNILLNAGEQISFFIFRNDNLGSAGLNFGKITLTGYLVDATP